MACAKIKSGQRWDPDMYMDVDEVAYPEGHSLWDQIPVPGAASMTLEALRSWFTTHHQLVLTELTLMHGAHARARALPVGALTPGTPPRVRLKVGERLLGRGACGMQRRQPCGLDQLGELLSIRNQVQGTLHNILTLRV